MKLIAIDPGLHKMGIAMFRGNKLEDSVLVKYDGLPYKNWMDYLDYMMARIDLLAKAFHPEMVVIEEPMQFMTSGKGQAASNSGAVLKLSALVFSIRQYCKDMGIGVMTVPVVKWKGQVPKDITKRRMSKRYDITGMNSDQIDALGIGDWYLNNCVLTVKGKND